MIVIDINGDERVWKMTGEVNATNVNKSNLHLKARQLLHEVFPTQCILEEVKIPIRHLIQYVLYLDFYIPILKMAIEAHGEQHYKYNSLFHNTQMDFYAQKRRDRYKQEWCEINNIDYIELPYNKKEKEWLEILKPVVLINMIGN